MTGSGSLRTSVGRSNLRRSSLQCSSQKSGEAKENFNETVFARESETALDSKLKALDRLRARVAQGKHYTGGPKCCNAKGCLTLAVFNIPGVRPGIRCVTHKSDDMIDVMNPTCQEKGCSRQPLFNYLGQPKAWCSTHKTEDMVNVSNRKCKVEGCNTRARGRFPDDMFVTRCEKHMVEGMLDTSLRNRKCEEVGCTKRPVFNFPGMKHGVRCAEHKEDEMIDVANRLCEVEHCFIRSSF